MASDEIFVTVDPGAGQQRNRMDSYQYTAIHDAILQNLQRYGSLTFSQFGTLVEAELYNTFTESIQWYYTTVKLEMETRGEIRRIPNSRPQLIEAA